jgi:hypothetical protein
MTFHPFPRLPTELREAIWVLALPRRLVPSSADFRGSEVVMSGPVCIAGQFDKATAGLVEL